MSQRLGLSGYFNSASALFRGIEATGRIRVAPWIRFDYAYDIQSSQQFSEPVNVLINNPYIRSGGQIHAIPLHKFNVGADYTGLRGYEAQLALYYIGNNNTLNRPAYRTIICFSDEVVRQQPRPDTERFRGSDQPLLRRGLIGARPGRRDRTWNASEVVRLTAAVHEHPIERPDLMDYQRPLPLPIAERRLRV